MLKPIIKIIKISTVCLVSCIIFSIIFEFVKFPHSILIQNFSIGSACSFIVVVVSTLEQYKVELKKILSDYISATSRLLFTMAIYQDDNGFEYYSDKQIERAFKCLEEDFENFNKCECEVLLLTKKKTEKQFKKNEIINRMYLEFRKQQFSSYRAAISVATDKDRIIHAIDTYFDCWPDGFEKENIAMVKEWLVEEKDDDHTE